MDVRRVLPNICSTQLSITRDFYVGLLGFGVAFDSDWFVQLVAPNDEGVAIGILHRDHGTVPEPFRRAPQGMILTFVVDDADAAHLRALDIGAEIILAPHDTEYGQRRLLLRDPDGTLVDVSSPTAPLNPSYGE